MRNHGLQTFFLRLGLAASLLSAVADRFGLWGPYGKLGVAWGDMTHFMLYVGKLNPWFPNATIPAVGWAVTVIEIALGALLLIGFQTRRAALLSGWLLLSFAIAMTINTGAKGPLDYSVFAASGGAFLLATVRHYRWSIDEAREPKD